MRASNRQCHVVVHVRNKWRDKSDSLTPISYPAVLLSLGERSPHSALVLVGYCDKSLSDHGSTSAACNDTGHNVHRQPSTSYMATTVVVLLLQGSLAESHARSTAENRSPRLHGCDADGCRFADRHSRYARPNRRHLHTRRLVSAGTRLGAFNGSQQTARGGPCLELPPKCKKATVWRSEIFGNSDLDMSRRKRWRVP